mmetsp:Transcript_60104/g.141829  ORF Transcript_60104/g.141829 Transcript_60104/m.141829 type:complete len:247 (+) Transcript_60104:1005-1745(+)
MEHPRELEHGSHARAVGIGANRKPRRQPHRIRVRDDRDDLCCFAGLGFPSPFQEGLEVVCFQKFRASLDGVLLLVYNQLGVAGTALHRSLELLRVLTVESQVDRDRDFPAHQIVLNLPPLLLYLGGNCVSWGGEDDQQPSGFLCEKYIVDLGLSELAELDHDDASRSVQGGRGHSRKAQSRFARAKLLISMVVLQHAVDIQHWYLIIAPDGVCKAHAHSQDEAHRERHSRKQRKRTHRASTAVKGR